MSETPAPPPPANSPQPPPPQQPKTSAAAAAAAQQHARTIWDEVKLCSRRVLRNDFQTEKATDKERATLAAAPEPVRDPMVQDFVAWRRSVLWVAALFLCLYAVLEVAGVKTMEDGFRAAAEKAYDNGADQTGQQPQVDFWGNPIEPQRVSKEDYVKNQVDQSMQVIGRSNAETIDGINMTLKFAIVVAAVCAAIAAVQWRSVTRSRRWARIGWIFMFAIPFVITFFPITAMMDFDHIQDKNMQEQAKTYFGATFALGVFLTIAPKAIALFPGIIRSSMGLKTLVPESATPGWIAALLAPLYAIFLLVLMSVINQAHGDFLLLGGIVCYMVGPLVFVWKAEQIVRPHTEAETTTLVKGVRQQASLFTIIGTVLLTVFIMELPIMDTTDAMSFMAGVAGNVLLMTIVASDFLVALLYHGYKQSREFAGTEFEAKLETKYHALSEVGFTRLRTMGGKAGPTATPPAQP